MIDNEVSAAIRAEIARQGRDGQLDRHTAAALSNFQPTTTQVLPGSISYLQSAFIGDLLLPPVFATANERAAYLTFGTEKFYVANDIVGINGEFKRADIAVTSTNIDLVVHGKKAIIDDREREAASSIGVNIEDQKASLIKTQVDTGREAAAATLLTTTGTYASATYYGTLAGATQWSHASSTPIPVINSKIEVVRAAIGVRPNVLWLSPTAFGALRSHASLVNVINGGATKQNPALPISAELIGSIFGLTVVVGESIQTTTVGGTPADIWNDCAGLLYVGPGSMDAPKFGVTLLSTGYPLQRVERNPHIGARGVDVLYYADAYKHVCQLNTAGYLWTDVTA